jgi:hypothetical protein
MKVCPARDVNARQCGGSEVRIITSRVNWRTARSYFSAIALDF